MTESEWLACDDPARMLDYLQAMNAAVGAGESSYPVPHTSDRKLRLFACACVRQVWHLLKDERSRQAVVVAERFADGEATAKELTAASDAARDAANAAWAAWTAARDAWTAAWVASAAACKSQARILRDIVGNPFRPMVTISPQWRTPTVLSLAQAAYEERLPDGTLDPLRLTILADALEKAGCDSEPLLRHLRGWRPCYYCWDNPAIDREAGEWCTYCGRERWLNGDFGHGPHVRGCWALDLILGKE